MNDDHYDKLHQNSFFYKKKKLSFKDSRTKCLQNNLNLTFYNYRDFHHIHNINYLLNFILFSIFFIFEVWTDVLETYIVGKKIRIKSNLTFPYKAREKHVKWNNENTVDDMSHWILGKHFGLHRTRLESLDKELHTCTITKLPKKGSEYKTYPSWSVF